MDNRAIGVFDSGIGGLTAVKTLKRLLPSESIVYFGDTGRLPYGERSAATIRKFARQDMLFLRKFDPKAILVACGTVSSNAAALLAAEGDAPVIGVVEPAARQAAALSKTGRIGLVGTRATVLSGVYEAAIRSRRPDAVLVSRACPLLAPMVEQGRVSKDDPLVRERIRLYFAPFLADGVDTLVLGCTHYPFLMDAIGDFLGRGVALIDAGASSAREMAALLAKSGALRDSTLSGERRYFVSGRTADFSARASLFLEEEVSALAGKADRYRPG